MDPTHPPYHLIHAEGLVHVATLMLYADGFIPFTDLMPTPRLMLEGATTDAGLGRLIEEAAAVLREVLTGRPDVPFRWTSSES